MAGLPFDFAHGPEPVEGLGGEQASRAGGSDHRAPGAEVVAAVSAAGSLGTHRALPCSASSGRQDTARGETAGRSFAPAAAPRSLWELCLLRPCSWITFSTN